MFLTGQIERAYDGCLLASPGLSYRFKSLDYYLVDFLWQYHSVQT